MQMQRINFVNCETLLFIVVEILALIGLPMFIAADLYATCTQFQSHFHLKP